MDARYEVLGDAAELAREFVDRLPERHVGASATVDELRTRLARPLTEAGEDPRTVIADLADRLCRSAIECRGEDGGPVGRATVRPAHHAAASTSSAAPSAESGGEGARQVSIGHERLPAIGTA